MDAIILSGGLGTRLGYLTSITPKPMLIVDGKPFLEHLLLKLKCDFQNIVLAVGYKSEIIKKHFTGGDINLPPIKFSDEIRPLGTGGAIKNALTFTDQENVFVFNGDSYIELDYLKMYKFHILNDADITIAGTYLNNTDRFGGIIANNDNLISKFTEKGQNTSSYINCGVYIVNRKALFKTFNTFGSTPFSFEKEILSTDNNCFTKYLYKTNAKFIDIGTVEDYGNANNIFI